MLNTYAAKATVAVKEPAAVRTFYSEILGLELLRKDEEYLLFKAGDSKLFLYRSTFAGTNQATSVTWTVGDALESLVKALGERGVRFEHDGLPDMKREGDIHLISEEKAAWFKAPEGNIHCLLNVDV